MKRKYQKPTMEVVLIKNQQYLLQPTGGGEHEPDAPALDPDDVAIFVITAGD